jgi:hypothetical protein
MAGAEREQLGIRTRLVQRLEDDAPLRRLLLALILLAAFVYRVWWAHHWNTRTADDAARLTGDEPGYDNLARELLAGDGFTWPGRTPLYPTWLAGVYKVFGTSYDRVPYVQIVLGLATVYLTYVLGRRMMNAATGLLAAAGAAVSYVLVHEQLHFLSEVLYAPVLLMVLISLWDAWHATDRKWWRWAWAGAWVGVANLVRPTLLMFPVFLALFLLLRWRRSNWRSGARDAAIYLTAALVVVAPWVVRNYAKYDAVFPLQTSNAFLWQGSPEYFHLVRDENYRYLDVWQKVIYGPGWRAHDPTSVDGDRWWTRRALRSIRDEPLLYVRYGAEKTVTYWIGDPEADWGGRLPFTYSALREAGFPPGEAVQVILARLLPLFALASLLVLRRRWRMFAPCLLLLGYVTLLHALAHAEVRLSEPLQPALLVLIAAALVGPRSPSSVEASPDDATEPLGDEVAVAV